MASLETLNLRIGPITRLTSLGRAYSSRGGEADIPIGRLVTSSMAKHGTKLERTADATLLRLTIVEEDEPEDLLGGLYYDTYDNSGSIRYEKSLIGAPYKIDPGFVDQAWLITQTHDSLYSQYFNDTDTPLPRYGTQLSKSPVSSYEDNTIYDSDTGLYHFRLTEAEYNQHAAKRTNGNLYVHQCSTDADANGLAWHFWIAPLIQAHPVGTAPYTWAQNKQTTNYTDKRPEDLD